MSRIAKLILILTTLLAGLAFHLKNNQLVTLNYYVGEISLSLSIVVVLTLFIGAILGILGSLPMMLKLKQQSINLNKQIKNSEREINNLRVMPIKD